MEVASVILLSLIVGMLGFVAGMMVRRTNSSQPDPAMRNILETLSTRLVEPTVPQPSFWPWTQLLDRAANRREIVQGLIESRENENGSLAEEVRFLACAQIATVGLLVESLERQQAHTAVEERELGRFEHAFS